MNHKRLPHNLTILLICLTACSSSRQQAFTYNEGSIFGTYYNIKYLHPEGNDLHREIKELFSRFDASLSTYNPESIISRVNRNDPDVVVDQYFKECFRRAQEISADTDGAFDITVGSLVNAWGFGLQKRSEITPQRIQSILEYTGYEKARMKNGRVVKQSPQLQFDVNAIAKGMAVDVIGKFLREQGCPDYMVEIGGEVVASGKNPQDTYWRIGINAPIDDPLLGQQEIQTVVPLRNTAMATSGNYRNFYIEDGIKYAHTIDPRTGYPVQHSLLSATVIARDCLTADAYATAFMVMGLDKAIKVVERHPDMQAYFIYSDESGSNQVWKSANFGN